MSRLCRVAAFVTAALMVGCAEDPPTPEPQQEPQAASDPAAVPEEVWVAVKPETDGDPVAVTATIEQRAEGPVIAVTLAIEPGYEIQPTDAAPPLIATTLDLTLPNGIARTGDWSTPKVTRSLGAVPHPAHQGSATFAAPLSAKPESATLRVTYQVCDARRCLRPVTHELTLRTKPQK